MMETVDRMFPFCKSGFLGISGRGLAVRNISRAG